jgi:monoterpene epsilon-lactone hydrolase
MQSLASRLMPLVMTLRGSKRKYSTADATLADITKKAENPAPSTPPAGILKKVDVASTTIGGWPIYTVSPRSGDATGRALYLHGGSYVYQIAHQHWTLIADLVASTGVSFTVPIFPLAPEGLASYVVPAAADLAATLIGEVGAENFSILGDSAGGGMAMAVALVLRDRGLGAPRATVLISPWLDISGTNPQLAVIAPHDPWLAVPGSHAAGALYRGDLDEHDPLVSPLFGDLHGLGHITMFSGTRDILNADAHRLVERATLAGLHLDYFEVQGMIHVYPLLPIPEARAARAVIRRAIAG